MLEMRRRVQGSSMEVRQEVADHSELKPSSLHWLESPVAGFDGRILRNLSGAHPVDRDPCQHHWWDIHVVWRR